jgi:hypothetical protein
MHTHRKLLAAGILALVMTTHFTSLLHWSMMQTRRKLLAAGTDDSCTCDDNSLHFESASEQLM